jgi:hypothetical protein
VKRQYWGVGEKVTVVLALLALLGATAAGVGPASTASTTPPNFTAQSCTQDNASISASDRTMLHRVLGPSVLFTYDQRMGTTVFYDPVNNVTVYETDLYEDQGFAEWNGDDTILSHGCVPQSASTGGAGAWNGLLSGP